jgi:hypothetical protein
LHRRATLHHTGPVEDERHPNQVVPWTRMHGASRCPDVARLARNQEDVR